MPMEAGFLRSALLAAFFTCSQWAAAQPCAALEDLRSMFMKHSTFEQAEDSERAAIGALQVTSESCRPYVEAHRWVSYCRAADFGWNVAERYQRFKGGMAQLDSLVGAHPGDDILCALRLSVSGTAPQFLGADSDWKTDAQAALRVSKTSFWSENPAFLDWMADLAVKIEAKTADAE
jgi:hypothetical protein